MDENTKLISTLKIAFAKEVYISATQRAHIGFDTACDMRKLYFRKTTKLPGNTAIRVRIMRLPTLSRLSAPAFFIGSLFILPLVSSAATIDPALAPRFTALSLLALSGALVILLRWRTRQPPGAAALFAPLTAVMGLHGVLMALSLVQAVNAYEGLIDVVRIALMTSYFVIAVVYISDDPRAVDIIVQAMCAAAICVGFVGALQYAIMQLDPLAVFRLNDFKSTMGHRNVFAAFMALTLPFSGYCVVRYRSYRRFIGYAAVILAVWCIVIAQTRSVWLAVTVAALCVGIVIVRLFRTGAFKEIWRPALRKTVATLALSIVIAAASGFIMTEGDHSTVQTPLERAASITKFESKGSAVMRLGMWNKTLHMIGDHWLFGVGAGNWKILFPSYGTSDLWTGEGERQFIRPHNDFLWAFAEGGVLAFAAYVWIVLAAAFYAYRLALSDSSGRQRALGMALLFGAIVFIVVSNFSFPKERIVPTTLFTTMLALGFCAQSRFHITSRAPGAMTKITPVVIIVMIFVLVFCTFIGLSRWKAESHTRKALDLKTHTAGTDRVIAELKQGLTQYAPLDPAATPIYWYLGVAYFAPNRIDQALRCFQQAHTDHPYHLHTLNNLATCYEKTGDRAAAIDFYRKALAVSPCYEESVLNLSSVYYNDGRYAEAWHLLQSCDSSIHSSRYERLRETVRKKLP